MNKTKKAASVAAGGLEMKSGDHFAGDQAAFSLTDYKGEPSLLQPIISKAKARRPKLEKFDWKRQQPGRILGP